MFLRSFYRAFFVCGQFNTPGRAQILSRAFVSDLATDVEGPFFAAGCPMRSAYVGRNIP